MMNERHERAEAIVEIHAHLAVAAGLLPAPLADMTALTLINIRMLQQLAKLYGSPLSRTRAETYLTALGGGFASTGLKRRALSSSVRWIPGIGPFIGAAALVATGPSITYAIGRIFIRRLEAGESSVQLDPDVLMADAEPLAPPEQGAARVESAAPARLEGSPDDLTVIKGIGPVIAQLLGQNGIRTFAVLAETPIQTLQEILDRAGPRYAYHDPATWPEQARLAAEGIDSISGTVSR